MSYLPAGNRLTGTSPDNKASSITSQGMECTLEILEAHQRLVCQEQELALGRQTSIKVHQAIESVRTHYGIGNYAAVVVGEVTNEPMINGESQTVMQANYIQIFLTRGMETSINSNEAARFGNPVGPGAEQL